MESNKTFIGKCYPQVWERISMETAHAYAAATDDPNPHYGEILAPPMALVTLTIPHGVAQVVQDNDLIGDPMRLLRLLHTEEEIVWHRPLRPDEELGATSTLEGIEELSVGEVLHVRTAVVSRSGEAVAETRTTLMIRQRNPAAPRRDDAARPVPLENPQWTKTWKVAVNQSERYAEASGDHNPIHLDDAIAQQASLKGRILHGLCTMAFAARSLVEHYGAGDPQRLRRLRVRFSRPVYMGDALTCSCLQSGAEDIAFVVKNQDGQSVLTRGEARVFEG